VDRLTGPGATEAAVRKAAGSARVLHLATHGFFAPPEVPAARGGPDGTVTGFHPGLLSGLVLAGANRPTDPLTGADDGVLTALEVSALDLRGVELAVLSACETGLGPSAGGEGVLGLQR
jgi:CHAT domain-containing protein